MEMLSFVGKYVSYHKRNIAIFLLFAVIFAVVFVLYGLPLGAVAYPAAVCVVLGDILIFFDGKKTYDRHMRLKTITDFVDMDKDRIVPPMSIVEEDYRGLLLELAELHGKSKDEADSRFAEMIDYYTLWVHQIKTPIAAMRLYLQDDSDKSRQLLADLFRIEQYVEMVLCYLRLDSDTTDYVFKEVRLDGVVRPSVKKFAGQFIAKKISLDYKPVSYTLLTDEKWFSFVLEQVLANAIKYTNEGSVTIDMSEPDTLCISDTGIGIAAEDLPRIFERGYTGCNGRSDKRASGLGLYLCKRICDNLGHTIGISSEEGVGTRVEIGIGRKMPSR